MNNLGMYEIRSLSPRISSEKRLVEDFLRKHDLLYENDIDYTIGFLNGEELIAVGSLSGKIIKGVVIDSSYRGENLTAKILTLLKNYAHINDIDSLFIYTSPSNRDRFEPFGYHEIITTEQVLLMEDSKYNFPDYLNRLTELKTTSGNAASIVMNGNPFTNGHRYLVERAASENEKVFLFVVEEDSSVFPFEIRFRLISEGVSDLTNVVVIPGGDYIISNATFPSYFIKDKGLIFKSHAELDLNLFGAKLAPSAGIVRRYVGNEPYCQVTNMYNESMLDILPGFGIEVIQLQRRESDTGAISASMVRRFIAEDNIEAIKNLVPPSTYNYLISSEAELIRQNIKEIFLENR